MASTDRDGQRRRLAATFDQAADRYQRARPEYPAELIERLLDVTHVVPGHRLLEVGCATGKATRPLAERGFRITCIEPGAALAAEARRNLAGFDVDIVEGHFETWRSPVRFRLVYAATAWHWIDPRVRYHRAAEALVPGGFLAFWSAGHVLAFDGDPFFAEIQAVYDEIGEGVDSEAPLPRPGLLDDDAAEIEASGLFEVIDVAQFDWETNHDAESYIDLLQTFSGHIAMQPWQQERLYGEIRRRLAGRPEQPLRRHWGAVLHIAQRRP